jgi:tRNA A37 threonylcarbamoyladenosine modification protein TsaB
MNILAIETTGAKASVALINEKGEVSLEASDEKMNHLQNLIPIIDALINYFPNSTQQSLICHPFLSDVRKIAKI